MCLDVIQDMSVGVEWADELSDEHVRVDVTARQFEEVRMVKRGPYFELSGEPLGITIELV